MQAGLYTIIGLTISNIFWEIVLKKKRWKELIERTYFQAIAIIYNVSNAAMLHQVNYLYLKERDF